MYVRMSWLISRQVFLLYLFLRFWEDVGKLMSKRDYTKTSVIIGGSDFANSLAGLEVR